MTVKKVHNGLFDGAQLCLSGLVHVRNLQVIVMYKATYQGSNSLEYVAQLQQGLIRTCPDGKH